MQKIKSTNINGHQILKNGVLVLDDAGVTIDLIPEHKIDFSDYETFEGYLVPSFVNAHCHLELSHMKNKVDEHTGLVDFVTNIQTHRNATEETITNAMLLAESEMINDGIVAVGDISNSSVSFSIKSKSTIYYHTFLEGISFTSGRAQMVLDTMLELKRQAESFSIAASVSPHAPYSVSRELFQLMSNLKENCYTLHHLESLAEIMFLKEKAGDFLKLYELLNINIDAFTPEEQSATLYWLNHFEVEKLILVHNTFLSDDAFDIIQKKIKNPYWCLCPNANLYIENRLPNIPSLIQKGAKICIGTDSLASNHQLSIQSEIKTIKEHFPEIDTAYLLQCASIHGAEALGIEKEFGQFFIGKKNPLVFYK
jgi:cytosine/adenosine deaminase-related metal-dependent hydrolase